MQSYVGIGTFCVSFTEQIYKFKTNKWGQTPLHFADDQRYIDIVNILNDALKQQ